MNDEELKQFSIPYIQKMFPDFKASNIKKSFVWKNALSTYHNNKLQFSKTNLSNVL